MKRSVKVPTFFGNVRVRHVLIYLITSLLFEIIGWVWDPLVLQFQRFELMLSVLITVSEFLSDIQLQLQWEARQVTSCETRTWQRTQSKRDLQGRCSSSLVHSFCILYIAIFSIYICTYLCFCESIVWSLELGGGFTGDAERWPSTPDHPT